MSAKSFCGLKIFWNFWKIFQQFCANSVTNKYKLIFCGLKIFRKEKFQPFCTNFDTNKHKLIFCGLKIFRIELRLIYWANYVSNKYKLILFGLKIFKINFWKNFNNSVRILSQISINNFLCLKNTAFFRIFSIFCGLKIFKIEPQVSIMFCWFIHV